MVVEEEQRGKGLVLRGSRDVTRVRKRREERGNSLRPQLPGMAPPMEHDEPTDPMHVGPLGPETVVAHTDGLADGLQESGGSGAGHNGHTTERGRDKINNALKDLQLTRINYCNKMGCINRTFRF